LVIGSLNLEEVVGFKSASDNSLSRDWREQICNGGVESAIDAGIPLHKRLGIHFLIKIIIFNKSHKL